MLTKVDVMRFLLLVWVATWGCCNAASAAMAVAGTAVVDGDIGEWDLNTDFYADMYEAGNPTKDLLSKLYLRYNLVDDVLYALVLVGPTYEVQDTPSGNAWIRIPDIVVGNTTVVADDNNSNNNPANPNDFAWVPNGSPPPAYVGYEASVKDIVALNDGSFHFELREDKNKLVGGFEAHLQVVTDRTSSTGKIAQSGQLELWLPDSSTTPGSTPAGIPEPGAAVVWAILGLVGLCFLRKSRR